MPKIKNVSPGIRTINAVVDDVPVSVTISPGQEVDLEVVNPNDRVFKGLVESGQLVVDGGVEDRKAQVAQERQELELRRQELDRREAEITQDELAVVHRRNPMLRDARQAAAIAGQTPGLADPLPPGTDTVGGEESKRALAEAGHEGAHGTDLTSLEEMAKGGPDRHLGTSTTPSSEGADSNRSVAQRQARPTGSGPQDQAQRGDAGRPSLDRSVDRRRKE